MILTQANSIYILKSTLTPQSKRKDMQNVSLSPNGSSSSPTCTNRKVKKPKNKKTIDNHSIVHVCFFSANDIFNLWRRAMAFALFLFVNF